MRKLFFQMMISLDGYVSGPSGELDWHVVDADFSRYVERMLDSIDAILLGRVTYEGFAGYWPSATEPEAPRMNALAKVVFSRTLRSAAWSHTRVVAGDAREEVERLKRQPGKDLALFGSTRLAAALQRLGLIDEYRLLVCPVLLGGGQPLFGGVTERAKLELTRSETFRSGVVALTYRPA